MELGESSMEGMEINKNFWRGKKIFLTGHTGFKGTWLSAWLKLLGAQVIGYSLPPDTNPNMFELIQKDLEIESIFGDVRDLELVKMQIRHHKPDIVIHLAAQSIVRQSYQYPIDTFQVNVIGTANVLEAVRYVEGIRAVVCITSDKCYENREWLWKYRENDPMGGWDPYSASKGCSELVISSFRNSFFHNHQYDKHGVAVASARAGNVVGGGDWGTDRLIPDIVRAYSENKNVIIRNPNSIRPWQHVLDLLKGYMLLTERLFEKGPDFAEAWNFGPSDSDELTVLGMVKNIAEMWGDGVSWSIETQDGHHEATMLKLDSSKARSRLGWVPQLSITDALDLLVQWYRNYYHNLESVYLFTEKQILSYIDKQQSSFN
jgi:CDP-glucose 4,6-dehydratase